MTELDKAINAYKDDIASESLRGKIEGRKFVSPTLYQIKRPIAQMRNAPVRDAEHVSQALAGEFFDTYEIKNGFAWGQLKRDDYVGYLSIDDIDATIKPSTHKIAVMRTNAYSGPKVQFQINANLTFGALVRASDRRENGYVWCEGFGYIYENHLCEIDKKWGDPVALAQEFIGTPYVWGGNSPLGVDCSGLVQVCFGACGIELPRDARLQEAQGQAISIKNDLSGLKRGDLVFWKGHVAIMLDEANLIHATAFTMMVSIERLENVKTRIDAVGIPIRAIKRVY